MTSEHGPVRAIIADDDPLARRAIKDALRRSGIVVVAEAVNGREAVELALYYRPDVILMDVVMPGLDGIAATRRILKEVPDQVIVMLTSGDEDEIGMVSLRAGASGFISKDVSIESLPRALRSAIEGEAAISRRLSTRLLEHYRRAPTAQGLRPVKSPLTQREWEVIDLLATGLSNLEIAEQLVLSTETVRTHVKHILRKLGAAGRAEAVAIARRMRDEPPPPGQAGNVK